MAILGNVLVIVADTLAELPADPDTGQLGLDVSTGLLYCYNGSTWAQIGAAANGNVLASGVSDVALSGNTEQNVFSFDIASTDIPNNGDVIRLEFKGINGTYTSGTDTVRVKCDGASAGDMTWHGATYSLALVEIQRVDATTLRVTIIGWRTGTTGSGTHAGPVFVATIGSLTFPVTLLVTWQGGHANNATTFKGYVATLHRAAA